jgi:BirA family biotin operon repressor/biotin-[acetyl-CoA-carboxylase] ligase
MERKIIHIKSCESTNKEVFKEKLLLNSQIDFCIFSDEQTKGRGMGSNVWFSSPGKNLTCSIVKYPSFLSPLKQFYISMVIGLGLYDFFQNIGLKSSIKWPNDIWIENKKIAGVLIESQIEKSKIKIIVAGIGLNINQENFPITAKNPVSLFNLGIDNLKPEQVMISLTDCYDKWYQILETGKFQYVKDTYLSRLLGTDKYLKYRDKEGLFSGKIIDILDSGQILMEIENSKKIKQFEIKEIELIFDDF